MARGLPPDQSSHTAQQESAGGPVSYLTIEETKYINTLLQFVTTYVDLFEQLEK